MLDFFFQAEDGIRDGHVTGVQTCALPIFFHGVKAILKAKQKRTLTSIDGAVIELIDVQKEYVTAIETVLGGQAQHIVVTDDQAAREAISWLKRTNNGRSTFLPLSSIQERFKIGRASCRER